MKSFQMKALTVALAATTAVLSGQAGAVNVNGDGLGQHLIYPYYTARAGNSTLLSVVNTTTQGKVVRVRFLEAKNSNDVLDFNLFLSPYDVWTGAVTKNVAGDGARLITADTSCTSPTKDQFTNLGNGQYSVDMFQANYNTIDGGAVQGLDRTFEGYVEIIEQAAIVTSTSNPLYVATKHSNLGVPPCTDAVVNASGYSPVAASGNGAVPAGSVIAPTGGLFGVVTFFGPVGTSTSVNATALDNFARTGVVSNPSFPTPNFGDGGSCTAGVTAGNTLIVADTTVGGICSTSAQTRASMVSLMADTVNGEYAYTGAVGSPLGTDWVLTMPGKFFLTNGVTTPVAPFTNLWDKAAKTACEPIDYRSYDREEFGSTNPTLPNCFSGSDAAACSTKTTNLCYEANVVSFGNGPGASAALQSANTLWLAGTQDLGKNTTAIKEGGWMTMNMAAVVGHALPVNVTTAVDIRTGIANATLLGARTFVGLPVIGFSATSLKTPNAPSLNNYGTSANLVPTRRVQ